MGRFRGHLVVDITGHGYGHAAQVAPVLRRLKQRHPRLRLTVRTRVPETFLRDAIGEDFTLAEPPLDLGMPMTGPIDVDALAAAGAYAGLHADWPGTVEREVRRLEPLRPDLVLSDVAYTSLAAAARAGVPAVALCSLNWADIYWAYCGDRPEAPAIHAQILDAYRSAAVFLQVTPHLPMADLPNRRSIGPVARLARHRRDAVIRALGATADQRLVLMSFGGISSGRALATLPDLSGVHWLVTPDLLGPAGRTDRSDVTVLEAAGLSFLDLMGSCDLVITKPGYGTIVEAVCNGTPVITSSRPDWPETPHLDGWARAHGLARMVDRERIATGDFAADVLDLLARPRPAPVPPTGVDEATAVVERLLDL